MIRVSTTTLESFRRLVSTEWGNEEELAASVRREPFKASWQMEAGTAWDLVLGDPDKYLKTEHVAGEVEPRRWHECNGHTFGAYHVACATAHIGPGVQQVKATRIFDIGVPVNVVAKADHCYGLMIQDNKAKFSTPDQRTYESSLQWRFYLAIHEASCFRYNLFDFKDPKNGYCELRDILSFRFWPYRGLHDDCRSWVRRFYEWAKSKNLLSFLEREGTD